MQPPISMMEAPRQHDEAIEGAASAHTGVPVRPRGEGDSRFIVLAVMGGRLVVSRLGSSFQGV
jgi:hypothetical protein